MTGGPIASWRTAAQGHLTPDENGDLKTDYSRWRLLDDRGRQTWHYLESDKENEKWPQSVADKHFLGLPTVTPLAPAATNRMFAIHVPDYYTTGTSRAAESKNSTAMCREWPRVFLQIATSSRQLGL